MKIITRTTIIFLVFYLVGSFMSVSFNPDKWIAETRYTMGGIALFIAIMWTAITGLDESTNSTNTKDKTS